MVKKLIMPECFEFAAQLQNAFNYRLLKWFNIFWQFIYIISRSFPNWQLNRWITGVTASFPNKGKASLGKLPTASYITQLRRLEKSKSITIM